jgi:RHS repeat-associated protein
MTVASGTAIAETTQASYFPCTGLKASVKGPNDIAQNRAGTMWAYDAVTRVTSVSLPDGGSQTVAYSDHSASNASPSTATTTTAMSTTPAINLTSVSVRDGLGRAVQTQLTSDPSGTDYVDTTYNGMGQVYTVSNPHRASSSSTDGITTYAYDPLGRKTQQTQPDKSTQSWSYNGNTTIFSDEAGNRWQRTVDALGRLTLVLEPTATSQTPTLETDYTYDALNNLVGVNQKGASGEGELQRTRSFTYDSLSRLICASNPESSYASCPTNATTGLPAGVTSYGYDANGNLSSKTDARDIGNIYSYDTLNRLTSKTPSNNTGASYFYNYDEKTVSWNTYSLTNTSGRLSSAWSQYGGIYSRYSYAYDAMGRQLTRYFQLPASSGAAVNTSTGGDVYLYDLAGNVTTIGNGAGVYLYETRDGAGHVTAVSSNKYTTGTLNGVSSHQIFANATYNPFGSPASRLLGNGLTENRTYDNRGRLLSSSQFQALSSIGYTVSSTYYPNGNVESSNDSVNGNWTYTYDYLNRLKGATSSAGLILGWTYDSFGNRWAQTASGIGSAPQPSFTYSKNNNHADASGGFAYDNAGNITKDNLGQTCAYYPDDSLATANALTGTAKYRYDSEGQLVFESGPNGAQVFLRDENGQSMYNDNITSGYVVMGVYIDGEQIGSWQHDQFFWTGKDWLGTKRYETAGNGDIASQAIPISPKSFTSLPFGDALSSIGNDPTHLTGKERDSESGLDYFGARYYGSSMGRFMSPDWAAKIEAVPYAQLSNPQTLNLYAYVGNNPTSLTDSNGHAARHYPGAAFLNSWNQAAGVFSALSNWMPDADEASYVATVNEQLNQQASLQAAKQAAQAQQLSQSGLDFLKCREGGTGCSFLSNVYSDSKGYDTIGYGHLVKKGENFSKGIDEKQAEAILSNDVSSAVAFVNGHLNAAQSQNQFDSLVSVAFSSPRSASVLLHDINAGSTPTLVNFIGSLKNGFLDQRGLLNRRDLEYQVYADGNYHGTANWK